HLSFFILSVVPHYLPSFPTRRSSDLAGAVRHVLALLVITHATAHVSEGLRGIERTASHDVDVAADCVAIEIGRDRLDDFDDRDRSEEHTSELQSRENLVCRLLLEKKK